MKTPAEWSLLREVVRQLGCARTYDVRRNAPFWVGAFWGLSIPIFAVVLAMSMEGLGLLAVTEARPGLLAFVAIPVFSGVVFSAISAVRRRAQAESQRTSDQWRELAMKDDLTGLYNRRHVMEELTRMTADSAATEGPVSVILIDLDGFKRVNDLRGHPEGDRVLRAVASALKGAIRESDILGRYGGDEFILLKTGDQMAAVRLVNRAIASVFESTGLTLCAGIACWPQNGTTPDELIASADTALLKLKRNHHESKSFAR